MPELDNEELHPIKPFISNSPTGEDLFEGRAHSTIANNIARTLTHNSNCKIIGLDGGWGTGKSNLVYQIRKRLKNDYHFFIYDAWGHQEDLQRRSLLEELLDDLIRNHLLDTSWKDRLKLILAKVKQTDSKKIPKLGTGIIATGLMVTLSIIAKLIAENVSGQSLKILITCTPLLLYILLILINIKKKIKSELKEGNFELCLEIIKSSFWDFFLVHQNTIEEEVKYETISEDEPSVKKFRDWMKEISDALKTKKLVIVFDNMDRLHKRKVQELWSSIHVFFAENSYENIRVIVPFDRAHVKTAFTTEGPNESKFFGNDFINKTFNIVYRVSPPILTDWKRYFDIKWKEAFGEESLKTDYYNNIVQIFDLLSEDITPRNIIAFINEFISIKNINTVHIPGKYIALFILGKDTICDNPVAEITNPTYLKGLDFLYKDDDELPKYIAALVYQIDPEKAIQLIFAEKLRRNLENNSTTDIQQISEITEFPMILENTLPKVLNIQNATLALNTLVKEKLGNELQQQITWECLLSKYQITYKSSLEEYQTVLLQRVKSKERLLNQLLAGIAGTSDFNITEYYNSINKLKDTLGDELDVFDYLEEKEVKVNEFIELVRLAKDDYLIYNVSSDTDELQAHLSTIDTSNFHEFDFVKFIKGEEVLTNYYAKLDTLLKAVFAESDKSKIEKLLLKSKEERFVKPFVLKIPDDQVYTVATNTKETEDLFADLVCMRLAKKAVFDNNYVAHFDNYLSRTDEATVEKVASRIEYYMSYGDLLLSAAPFNKYPLYKLIVQKITAQSYGISRLDILNVFKDFDNICHLTEIKAEDLLKRIDGWKLDTLTSENLITHVSINLFKKATKPDGKIGKRLTSVLTEYLNSLDQNKWESILSENSKEIEMLLCFDGYEMNSFGIEGVKETLNKIAGKKIESYDVDIWRLLIERELKQGKNLKATFNTIRDTFIREQTMDVKLFLFFGEWLFEHADLIEQKGSLRTIFKLEVIHDAGCLNKIHKHKEMMPNIIAAAKEEAEDFLTAIKELYKTNKSDLVKDIAIEIGVSLEASELENPKED